MPSEPVQDIDRAVVDGMLGFPEGSETLGYLTMNMMHAAQERYERALPEDVENAVQKVLELFSEKEQAAWTLTNDALKREIAEDVATAARKAAGPVWEKLSVLQNALDSVRQTLSVRPPASDMSEMSENEKAWWLSLLDKEHRGSQDIAGYGLKAREALRVVLDSGFVGEELHQYADEFVSAEGYENIESVRIWEWFGGYLAYTGPNPPSDGLPYEYVGTLPDGKKVWRPSNVLVPYLLLVAQDRWLERWNAEAVARKRDHDASMVRMHKTVPRSLTHVPLPADKSSVDIALSVNAGTDAALARGARVEPVPTEIIIDFGDDSEPLQLVLPFDGTASDAGGPLMQVNRHFGDSKALSFLLSAITAHWTSGAEPEGTFPVYADELAWLMGVDRLHFSKQVERFGKAIIHAKYGDEEIVAPFLQMTLQRKGRGGKVDSGMAALHPVLALAVARGGQYWPASIEILQTSASTARFKAESQALAVLVANQFSVSDAHHRKAKFSKRIGGEKGLASVLGYGTARPERQLRYIERAAKDLHDIGFLGDYEVVEGSAGLVLNASPGELRSGRPARPARLPHTGHTLRQWCSANGGISASSRLLGLSRSYLHKQIARGHLMLSSRMRRSLREYLWPDPSEE